jgi:hypothetical protein
MITFGNRHKCQFFGTESDLFIKKCHLLEVPLWNFWQKKGFRKRSPENIAVLSNITLDLFFQSKYTWHVTWPFRIQGTLMSVLKSPFFLLTIPVCQYLPFMHLFCFHSGHFYIYFTFWKSNLSSTFRFLHFSTTFLPFYLFPIISPEWYHRGGRHSESSQQMWFRFLSYYPYMYVHNVRIAVFTYHNIR